MSDTLLKDLEAYNDVRVALESSVHVPSDAQKILEIFMGPNSTVSNEADYEHDVKDSALRNVAARAKEVLAKVMKWIMERYAEFKAWTKEYLLAVDKALDEVDAAKALIMSHPIYKTGKITLLPTVTGALAVEGRLDDTFPDKFTALRGALTMLINIRDDTSVMVEEVLSMVKKHIGDQQEGEPINSSARDQIIKIYAKVAEPISRVLSQPNPSKTLTGNTRASHRTLHREHQWERVQDVASLPLPGGYAITSVLAKENSIKIFANMDTSFNEASGTLAELMENLSPNLEKVYNAGVTFSGAPLNQRKCQQIIEEGTAILNLIKNNPDKVSGMDKELRELKELVAAIDKGEYGTALLHNVGRLMRASVKLIESDRFQTYRYAVKTVRASLRYISASVEKEKAQANDPAMRLGAPA